MASKNLYIEKRPQGDYAVPPVRVGIAHRRPRELRVRCGACARWAN
jgi:hypothetical protein